MNRMRLFYFLILGGMVAHTASWAEPLAQDEDLLLHMVAVAHLDTQWRWTVRDSIDPFLRNTLDDNFRLFEQYPDYLFNFEGAFRYDLMKEYYPERFERMKSYIREGRWHVSGAAMDALDMVMPSPESIIRSVLHAQRFYREEFGLEALDFFLPDSFGFPVTLPTLAAHVGGTGFSTQKLGWGSSVGIPFHVGVWEGIDGSPLPSVLHAGPYDWKLRRDVSQNEGLWQMIRQQQDATGFGVGFRYFGVGDIGGAPEESTVAWIARAVREGEGRLPVLFASSSDIFAEMTPAHQARLPRYRGELLMQRHGTGSYTSYSPIKQWIRHNERIVLAAERAALAARHFAGADYPVEALRQAWLRYGWHHQHDGITGTSIPPANDIMINDQVVSFNQFTDLLRASITSWAALLDTRGPGQPVIVYNPSAQPRRDLVEIEWPLADASASVSVQRNGQPVTVQRVERPGQLPRLLFEAEVPAIGLAVYHVVAEPAPSTATPHVQVPTPDRLQVGDWIVQLNDAGQIAAITEQTSGRNWLHAPVEWQFLPNNPSRWAAWEIEFHDILAEPVQVLTQPVQVEVLEAGPLRGRVRVAYTHGDTHVQQDVVVQERNGQPLIQIDAVINWQTYSNILKVAVPAHANDPLALYDLGLGQIERGVNAENLYEVPAHEWAAIGERDGTSGLALFSQSKVGWDRPQPHVLRHTMIHSPNELTTDFGTHRVRFALAPLTADWTRDLHAQAEHYNMPLLAFGTEPSAGAGAVVDSLAYLNEPGIRLLALKQEEDGERVVVRVGEMEGLAREQVSLTFPHRTIRSVHAIDGLEKEIGPGTFAGQELTFALPAFGLRAWAVELETTPPRPVPVQHALPLPDDVQMTAQPGEQGDRLRLPVDQLPVQIRRGETQFELTGSAVRSRGQRLEWTNAAVNRLELLVASLAGDRDAEWQVGEQIHTRRVPDLYEEMGYAEHWIRASETPELNVRPALVKRDAVVWNATRLIDKRGDVLPYTYAYLFRIELPVAPGEQSMTLPFDPDVLVFAATALADTRPELVPLNDWGEAAYRGIAPDRTSSARRWLGLVLPIVLLGIFVLFCLRGDQRAAR
jgi:alpha-mannosidase